MATSVYLCSLVDKFMDAYKTQEAEEQEQEVLVKAGDQR